MSVRFFQFSYFPNSLWCSSFCVLQSRLTDDVIEIPQVPSINAPKRICCLLTFKKSGIQKSVRVHSEAVQSSQSRDFSQMIDRRRFLFWVGTVTKSTLPFVSVGPVCRVESFGTTIQPKNVMANQQIYHHSPSSFFFLRLKTVSCRRHDPTWKCMH